MQWRIPSELSTLPKLGFFENLEGEHTFFIGNFMTYSVGAQGFTQSYKIDRPLSVGLPSLHTEGLVCLCNIACNALHGGWLRGASAEI